jgi:hypothetical protein
MKCGNEMDELMRTQLENQAAQAYLELGDAIRLATLPVWITADLTISQLKTVFLLDDYGALAANEVAGLLGIFPLDSWVIIKGRILRFSTVPR